MTTGLSKSKWNGLFFEVDGTNSDKNLYNRTFQLIYDGKLSVEDILNGMRSECDIYWESKSANCHNNNLYFGDNLTILRSFLDDKAVAGKVELIYIDPPFATNKVYQSTGSNGGYTDLLQGATYLEFIRDKDS
jgi:adenine-specific DNA-methyltransferase